MTGQKSCLAKLAVMVLLVGAPHTSQAAWLDDDLAPSRRVPDLLVSLFPAEIVAHAEQETLYPKFWPVRFYNVQSQRSGEVRLYDVFGAIDPNAAAALDDLLADGRDREDVRTTKIDRRVLQLIFKAAYHFRVHQVTVISGYRDPGRNVEGRHGQGKAADVQFKGVAASTLAAYLRTQARVGVGVYTHPRTQFVHVDDRDASFHWLDASPPGRKWRERALGRSGIAARDQAYRCEDDWPEGPVPRVAHECGATRMETDSDLESLSAAGSLGGTGTSRAPSDSTQTSPEPREAGEMSFD